MSGFPTLLYKEVLRFWKVSTQTIAAPALSAVLFLFIFSHVMEGRVRVYDAVPYAAFLVPGLVMMSVLQNAFANTSSSLVQSKMTGNIIFVLLPPLAYWEFFAAYTLAAVVRGWSWAQRCCWSRCPSSKSNFATRCGSSRLPSARARCWARSG